ncbi:MAG: tetratricopeptide repeat protein [Acidobacteriota bacterium]
MRRLACLVLLATVAACARTPAPVVAPVVSTPRFPDFMAPVVPADFGGTAAASAQDLGWRLLQAGELKGAEREFNAALKTAPAFYPAAAALGWLEMARKDMKAALPHFDRALERQPADLSSLVGRGQALLALNREADALTAFQAALAVDPSLPDLAGRVAVLQFRGQQDNLNRAREAVRAGRADDAVALYNRAIASSPDSSFLYRELAAVERLQGPTDAALEHLRKAVSLEPGDARSLAQIGDILDARGDVEGAIKAYQDSLAIEPNDDLRIRMESARARVDLARLPVEYHAIERAAPITRGDLAALIGVRLAPLLLSSRSNAAVVITDLRNHWAAPWIMSVARAGVIEPFANHTFQPAAPVRRSDLAQVVSRLLGKAAESAPGRANPWQASRMKFSDIAAGHLAYPAASAAVASGVLTVGANNSFQPTRTVTGQEAIEAIGRIEALTPAAKPPAKSGR